MNRPIDKLSSFSRFIRLPRPGSRLSPSQLPPPSNVARRIRVLYLSYDGLLDPLGQSQVLQYLRRLARDHEVDLITFEKPAAWRNADLQGEVSNLVTRAGIRWHPLEYHHYPPVLSTVFDVVRATYAALQITRRRSIQIVHARSYVPAISALLLKRRHNVKFCFDMRGLWADERVDGGVWSKRSLMYRVAKAFESRFLEAADAIVILTHVSKEIVHSMLPPQRRNTPIVVIPTCTDLELFRPAESPSPSRPFTLGAVGNLRHWYLLDPLLECAAHCLRLERSAKLLLVTRDDESYLRSQVKRHGIPQDAVQVCAVDYTQVPAYLRLMNAGAFFTKPCISRQASAPTKLGEFLAAGLPCISNDVGDVGNILRSSGTGVVLPQIEDGVPEEAVSRLIALTREPDIHQRCRAAAEQLFDVDKGSRQYDTLYRELAQQ